MKSYKLILALIIVTLLTICIKNNVIIRDWCIAFTFNSVCFVDNSFNISRKFNPILIWSVIFSFGGMCCGMIRAVNRFKLNRLIIFAGIFSLFLILLITVLISRPLRLGNSQEVGEKRLWDKINAKNSYNLSVFYLTKYPQGKYESQVRIKQEEAIWDSAFTSNTFNIWNLYVQKFPSSIRSSQAKKYLEISFWNGIKKKNTVNYYQNYLANYPNGMFTSKANLALRNLQKERERNTKKPTDINIQSSTNAEEPVKEISGNINLPDGRIYKGILVNGEPGGKGVETFPDNSYLEGVWVNGKREGVFILHNVNGTTQTQEFNNGNRVK